MAGLLVKVSYCGSAFDIGQLYASRPVFFATGTCIGARKAAGQYLNNPCGAGTFRRLKVHYASSIFISS